MSESDFYEVEKRNKKGLPYTVKRARTLLGAVRYRPEAVASLASYLISLGEIHQSVSSVLKRCLELHTLFIKENFPEHYIADVNEAIEFLQSKGIIKEVSDTNKPRVHSAVSGQSLMIARGKEDIEEDAFYRAMYVRYQNLDQELYDAYPDFEDYYKAQKMIRDAEIKRREPPVVLPKEQNWSVDNLHDQLSKVPDNVEIVDSKNEKDE